MMKKKKSSRKKAGKRPREAGPALQEPGVFPIVGVGASAGGLEAFIVMVKNLPENTGMAFVLVQHLDPTHPSALSEILSRTAKMPVVEVTDGMTIIPNRIHVMPANTTMILQDGEFRLSARLMVRGQHLPIDYFFQSLAEECGDHAIGVILSGTASDGTEGCRAIKAAGGITFAQDEASAKFTSMPHSATSAGLIDFVMPPRDIAKELTRIGRHPSMARKKAKLEPSTEIAGGDLSKIVNLIREASGVDFALYKQSTLQRRIHRRMVLQHIDDIKSYLAFVQETPEEIDELYRDMLIHVTGFFRDKQSYDALAENVFPALIQSRKLENNPIRIWVPGCSTGEEAYSIAIRLLEFLWEKTRTGSLAQMITKAIQIFATDISESALDRARLGLYTAAAVAEVSPERLSSFFVRLDGGYQINKSIREICVFARQNVAKDPPFSNLDLISCRNLLIYLAPELQKRVIPTLHYALKPDGYLILGASESLGAFSDHFVLIDKKYKIYQKKRTAARLITYFTGTDYTIRKSEHSRAASIPPGGLTVDKEVERVLVNRFVPASIVVNDQMEIVQFRGRTGSYLEPAPGHPTFSLSKMAREGLLVDLRAALNKARKTNAMVRAEKVHVRSDGHTKEVDLEVIPVRGQGSPDPFYIVVFQESGQSGAEQASPAREKRRANPSYISRENERLKRESGQLREQLKTIIEEHETTSEEFKSANEEVLSANEELQSTNEELETSKEELQSTNEELTTLNEELGSRNTELNVVNNDLLNLLGNVSVSVLMVGNDLRIRRFTPAAQKLLNLIPGDVGRRLREIRPNLDVDDIVSLVQATIETATLQEQEVQEKDGAWYVMRVRPYKTWDRKIDGAVISFQDIDDLKRRASESRSFSDALIQNAREAILILDSNLRISVGNQAFSELFQLGSDQVQNQLLSEIGGGQWMPPGLRERLQEVVRQDVRLDEIEFQHDFPKLGRRTMLFDARRIEPSRGQSMIMLSIEDITDYKRHFDDLQTHSALLELANDAVFVRDLEGTIQLWNRGAERIYGWRKSEAIGKNVSELLKTVFPIPVSKINKQMQQSGYWEGELVHTRKDGQQRTVESRWSIHREGNPPIILELNTDVTDRKLYEQELRRLSGQLMQVQDEERRRIARDLHDSTGQKLAALKMSIAQGKNSTPRDEQMKLVDDVLQEIRTVSQILHPPLLEEAGLLSAARWLVEGFSSRSGIKVSLNVTDGIGRLSGNAELALFRVIQEALNNIHRHSGAKKAKIEVEHRDNALTLRVSDDGRGMPHPQTQGSGSPTVGVGLLGMRERMSQLGGTLTIQSGEKGTMIEAELPLNSNSKE